MRTETGFKKITHGSGKEFFNLTLNLEDEINYCINIRSEHVTEEGVKRHMLKRVDEVRTLLENYKNEINEL